MKILKILLIIILVILLIPISINFYVIFSTRKNIYNIDNVKDNYNIALVLGCGVKSNGEPSYMLKDRLDASIKLYENGIINNILISGTHKEDYSEVDVMEKYLVKNGIPKDDILKDYEGNSTSESIKNFKKNYEDKSFIIITQKYHLYRSLYLAKRSNLKAIGVYAKEVRYKGQIYRDIREILARVKDVFINQ